MTASKQMKQVSDMVAVTVARGRSVQSAAGAHGPGSTLDMAPDEAAFLTARGFVTLAGQEAVEPPRTIRVKDASPDRIGLQTGAQPSWEEDLAASRRGAP